MKREDFLAQLIERTSAVIDEHKDELTQLDQAIGDGDHGINMQRGFNAILAEKENLIKESLASALEQAGRILVMKVGGASGPLYGSLLMAMGKNLVGEINQESFIEMSVAGVEAVKMRGRAEENQKTMLDVLIPVLRELKRSSDPQKINETAQQSLENTRAMKALKGRAAFLGERSIGHLDPGARSSALLIAVVCELLEEENG